MYWQYTLYMIPLVTAAAISAALALYAWRHRPAPGATPFALLMVAVAEWSLGYALELGSTDLLTKGFWTRIEFLGVTVVPVTWLAFTLQYTGWEKWLTRRNLVLLTIEPLATLLLHWTNEVHGLIARDVRLDTSGSFPVLDLTYGAGFWVHTAYSYLLLLLGTFLLLQALIRSPRLYRGQAGAVLIAALAPWVGNVLYISGLSPFPYLDLTPFAFALTGLAVAWGLFRFRLLDIVPVARDAVIEGMSDGVIVLDTQNRIVDLNLAAQRITSRPASETIGQPAAQVFSAWPDLVERYRDVTEVREEFVLGEGEAQRCFDLHISPLYDRSGRLTGRLIVLRDITERKRADEVLQRRREELQTILDSVPAAIFYKDKENRFIRVNRTCAEELGRPMEEIEGKSCFEIFPPDQAEDYWRDDKEVMASGHSKRNIIEPLETPKGTRWVQTDKIPYRDEKGSIIGVIGFAVDITERKRAEEELKDYSERLEEMVEERTEELRDAQARLIQSEKLAATGRLAISVAHEINNPLQGISNYLSLISQQVAPDDPLHEDLEMVKLGFERIAEIVRRLRAFYRPAGEGMEPTDINGVVERVLALVDHQFSLGNVEVKTELAERELPVLGSAGQLEQVLVNLALNAQEAMPQGGELMVRTTLRKGVVQLQVTDTGRGISEEEMSRLFRPFYGGRGGKGLGLGLWISHNIIEGHGGSIEVESQVGEGTTFIISLPAYQRER